MMMMQYGHADNNGKSDDNEDHLQIGNFYLLPSSSSLHIFVYQDGYLWNII